MLRVRKLVLAMAAASALSSGMAHALGLGEITLKSSLNQPLEAEIELVEARDLAPNEVLPSLATPEEFNKAGVERQFFLTDLKFTPVIKPNGKSVIRITSSKTVREPYLNFLVEVLWPNGRLLREYTVLLDPPLYSPQAAAAPRAAVTAPIARTTVAPAPRPAPRPAASASASRPANTAAAQTSAPSAPGSNQYRTQNNDNLWEIAQRSRQNGSVQQAMLAIQDLNPDAFIDGNINRMKRGQVLRLPDQADISKRSQAEAVAQVNEQNAAWREGRSVAAGARQLDATKREVAGSAPAQAKSEDKLKLVSAETGKATAGSDKGQADSEAISNKLAVTQESLDSTRRANEELSGRMSDLQGQVDKLQRLIKLKDDQLAKLQADLAKQGGAAATAAAAQASPESAPETTSEPAAPAADTSPAPTVGTDAPADAPESAAAVPETAAPGETEEPDFNYSEEPAATPQASAPAEAVAPEPTPAPAPEPAKPVAPAVQPAPASMVDDLLANPMLLGIVAAGGLLALLVLLMIISRRKAQKESEQVDDSLEPDNGFAAEAELPDDSFAGLDDDLDLGGDQADIASEARTTPQTTDVLGEADIYIAYGRFNQAAELLQGAINDEPERSDLQLKLMEVYAEMGDRDGYARQQEELRAMGGATEEVALLNAKYPAMAGLVGGVALTAAAENELDSFSLDDLTMDDIDSTAEPVDPRADVVDSDDSFDLSLDDLESELDSQLQSTASNDMGSFDLDTELEQSVTTPVADQDDDLGFELSLDEEAGKEDELADFNFDLDSTPVTEQPGTVSADDDFLLSLDDDLPPAVEPVPETAAKDELEDDFGLPDDFDLSLSDELDVAPSAKPDNFAAQLDEVTAELDQLSDSLEQQKAADELDMPEFTEASSVAAFEDEDDFDFLSGTDETATKLDLARAYIDMGDSEGARDILDEVVAEGNDDQQKEAKELIDKLV